MMTLRKSATLGKGNSGDGSPSLSPPAIGYLAKSLPSDSGIARYAHHFVTVLRMLDARIYVLPIRNNAADTQRFSVIRRVCLATVFLLRQWPPAVLHVELSGRALAEFYSALAVSLLCPRVKLWVTLHDAPYVTGGACYFRLLDRRILQRLASLLSKSVGLRLERYLLQRAEHVFCLSRRGAAAVEVRYALTRPVEYLPHVAQIPESQTRLEDDLTLFCPGRIGHVHAVTPVLQAIAQPHIPQTVRVEIGYCDVMTERELRRIVNASGLAHRVVFLGYIAQEEEWDAAFARAAIVVQHRPQDGRNQTTFAVSGPTISAMSHGCAIISSDPRGAHGELVDTVNAIDIADRPGDIVAEITRLIINADVRQALGSQARDYAINHYSPLAIVRMLQPLVNASSTSESR